MLVHPVVSLRWILIIAFVTCVRTFEVKGFPVSNSETPISSDTLLDRRKFMVDASSPAALAAAGGSALLVLGPSPCTANEGAARTIETSTASSSGLASRLAKRDPTELRNRIFNIPPSVQVYPEWMRGDWQVTSRFSGFVFPSTRIPKKTIIGDFAVPGFQKCSIAQTADIGIDQADFRYRIDPKKGWEDRTFNMKQTINAFLGYGAVSDVIYDGKKNPNRISIDFVDYRTINAERIELFCNARESELYSINTVDETTGAKISSRSVFVASEHIKQVTFGTGSAPGVPRQVSTNFGLFWTWKQQPQDANLLQGNLLVAAYLDPQDSLYFQEPANPVVIYSHVLTAGLKRS